MGMDLDVTYLKDIVVNKQFIEMANKLIDCQYKGLDYPQEVEDYFVDTQQVFEAYDLEGIKEAVATVDIDENDVELYDGNLDVTIDLSKLPKEVTKIRVRLS